jgi:hypothetical protein
LYGKTAEVGKVNGAICRLKVGASTVVRSGAIGIQPVVGYYFKVFIINIAIRVDVRSQAIICRQDLVAV